MKGRLAGLTLAALLSAAPAAGQSHDVQRDTELVRELLSQSASREYTVAVCVLGGLGLLVGFGLLCMPPPPPSEPQSPRHGDGAPPTT